MARVVLDVWLDFVTVVPDIVVEAPVGVQTDVVELWQNLLVVSPFNAEVAPATAIVEPDMTLVNGRTFAISDAMGSIVRPLHGIVFEDLRVISHLRITVDGSAFEQPELLASSVLTPFSSISVSRPTRRAGQAQPPDLVVQRRWLGRGYRHDFEIHNTGSDAITRSVTLSLGGDFAHLFDVKSGAAPGESAPLIEDDDAVRLVATDDSQVSVRVVFSSAPDVIRARERLVSWHISVPPGQRHTLSFAAEPWMNGQPAGLLFDLGTAPSEAVPLQRLASWHQRVPVVVADDSRLEVAAERCFEDLASLRIFSPNHPGRVVIAAGAPWFMTLFGRDSLLTSLMALPFAPEIAGGVIRELAELQGKSDDAATEEQPGKVIHELRRRGGAGPFAQRERYYGTVDATPLFVMLATEAHRWGALDADDVAGLWPSILASVSWIRRKLGERADGFIAYERSTDEGLQNQGWKDSWDGVTYASGELASGPVALAEVQGYAYAALIGAAGLARMLGVSDIDPDRLDSEAVALKTRFNRAFWLDREGYFAIAVDGNAVPIDSCTTNPGHALWCGIADSDKAHTYLDRLASPDLWTGWGLRTLAASMGAYDPLSYHNGSVWPHDTALCAAGAARYGRWELVDQIIDGALAAASHFGGRPPELFAGVGRDDVPVPVAYPSSSSPQAWASASVLLLLSSRLGLSSPSQPGGAPTISRPSLVDVSNLDIDGINSGGTRYRIRTSGDLATIEPSTR